MGGSLPAPVSDALGAVPAVQQAISNRCCVPSTQRFRHVVHVQRNTPGRAKYFAKEKTVWCNSDNFPKGGWPGDPAGAQECLHLVSPFAPEPSV